jgi:Flp pilus assembly protein TadB
MYLVMVVVLLVLLVLLVAASVVAATVGRRLVRRYRWMHRLEQSESAVESAVAEDRLRADTGHALMQHLEGLRRECSGSRGE